MLEGVFLNRLADLVVPPSCGGCDLPGGPICAACRAALTPLAGPVCAGCGHPWAVATGRCVACRGPLAGARQAFVYAGPVPALLGALKDQRRRALVDPLAELMMTLPPPAAPLVPVPLARERLAERGFNQAALLADRLAAGWDLPVLHLLERARGGPPQRGAAATTRALQVRGAFAVRPGPVPAAVCLIDDVHTTGATLAAAALCLRRAGVALVGARCLARALSGLGAG